MMLNGQQKLESAVRCLLVMLGEGICKGQGGRGGGAAEGQPEEGGGYEAQAVGQPPILHPV